MAKPIKAVDNRKPNGTFGAGNNANPLGRPKGQTLKEYWRQRFAEMTDKEKIAFTEKVGNDFIWKMAEGNPSNEITGKDGKDLIPEPSERIKELADKLHKLQHEG